MKIIELTRIPVCRFAHVFSADRYSHSFGRRESLCEITYIAEGEITVTAGEKEYRAGRGDVLINPFREELRIESVEYHCHHTVAFEGDFKVGEGLTPVITGISDSSQIYYLIDEIISERILSPENENKLSGLFLQLIGELIAELTGARESRRGELHYVRRAKRYIYDNIRLPIKQSELAAFLGITPEYLCSVFKRGTGETVKGFVNRVKLSEIRNLMEREDLPLNRAAELYGFSDPNYVSRLYRLYHGKTITDETRVRYKK